MRIRIIGIAAAATTLASCGTAASSSSPTTAVVAPTPAKLVYTIDANKGAQMVEAGQPASFTITALDKASQPVVGAPVSFFIGSMVPLSGIGPKSWNASGTSMANPYISSYSKTTNKLGEATLELKAQPTNTMEMVGVSVGDLSSYIAGKGALGSMDAWWSTPSANPGVQIGNFITATPFVTMQSSKDVTASVSVGSSSGPITGAAVTFTPKVKAMSSGSSMTATTASSGGMSSNSGSANSMVPTGGSTSAPIVESTNSSGVVTYSVRGPSAGYYPLRIVSTTPSSTSVRIAGGMNLLFGA